MGNQTRVTLACRFGIAPIESLPRLVETSKNIGGFLFFPSEVFKITVLSSSF